MRIRILGAGCEKCDRLYEGAVDALERFPGPPHVVEKVEDVQTFAELGVRVTPALVIEEEVVSSGRVLSADDIEALIRDRME